MDTVTIPPARRWPPRGTRADQLLAAVSAAAAAAEVVAVGYGADTPVVVALVLVVAACLAWRRTRPLPAIAVAMGSYALLTLVDVSTNDLVVVIACLLVLVYSVAMWERRLPALAGLALALAAVSTVLWGEGGKPLGDYVYAGSLIAAAWGFGRAMRARVLQVATLAEETARADLERRYAADAASAEERRRIARELHDIVSHGLSAMVVQAAAAEALVDDAPTEAVSALRSIQEAGRDAQAEMVRMLGVLRERDRDAALAPTPGVDEIVTLVDRMEATGLPVTLCVRGNRRPLPAGVGLTTYRIVQEALTNVRRHAGLVATTVEITYGPSDLRVTVSNAPRVGDDRPSVGAGFGLIGMRERVATCGGTLDAARSADGGFVVVAELPLLSPSSAL